MLNPHDREHKKQKGERAGWNPGLYKDHWGYSPLVRPWGFLCILRARTCSVCLHTLTDLFVVTPTPTTLQHYAVKHRKAHMIAPLVKECGHDMTARDNNSNPPMLWCMDPEGLGCIDELLACGADINITDKCGLTLLYWVVTSQLVRGPFLHLFRARARVRVHRST